MNTKKYPVRLGFHASSVIINGKAVLFSGDGGMGKSTIAESLRHADYDVPGDETAYCVLCDDGIWRLKNVMQKVGIGDYYYIDMIHPPEVALVVLLRSHIKSGYTLTPCTPARAVQESFRRLFCDRLGDEAFLPDAFRWCSSLFRQAEAQYLDYEKTIAFISDIEKYLERK